MARLGNFAKKFYQFSSNNCHFLSQKIIKNHRDFSKLIKIGVRIFAVGSVVYFIDNKFRNVSVVHAAKPRKVSPQKKKNS